MVTSMNTVSTQTRKYELKARAESQRETRDRIAATTAALHEEKGVAATTVAEIARRLCRALPAAAPDPGSELGAGGIGPGGAGARGAGRGLRLVPRGRADVR